MNIETGKKILSVAALSLITGFSMNASADNVSETVVLGHALPQQSVSFYRSELATAEGLANVERRIERAAEQVCGSLDFREVGSLSRVAQNRECYDGAIAQAMSTVADNNVARID